MFPEFEKLVQAEDLLNRKLSGNLSAKLPRILGQGNTKAKGLDAPPSPIERKQELVTLDLPKDWNAPQSVLLEIEGVATDLKLELKSLCSEAGVRKLASNVLNKLDVESKGIKNGYFHAGGFLLIPDQKKSSWSWSITPHYPVIEKVPPDQDYLVKAFAAATETVKQMIFDPRLFERKLELSWLLAQHFAKDKKMILLSDVAKMYGLAVQDNKFWGNPKKSFFIDAPAASFIANLTNYKRTASLDNARSFEFMPATLNDSYKKDVYHLPMDREGTQTRPYVYIVRKS